MLGFELCSVLVCARCSFYCSHSIEYTLAVAHSLTKIYYIKSIHCVTHFVFGFVSVARSRSRGICVRRRVCFAVDLPPHSQSSESLNWLIDTIHLAWCFFPFSYSFAPVLLLLLFFSHPLAHTILRSHTHCHCPFERASRLRSDSLIDLLALSFFTLGVSVIFT